MESYLDTLPNELLYNIIYYINDKYEINKLCYTLKILNDDDMWKDMLYINIKDPIINKENLWKDNYLDNLNIKSKYNIDHVNLHIKYDYAIVFRKIKRTVEEMSKDMYKINREFHNYVTAPFEDKVIFIISNLKDVKTIVDSSYNDKYKTICQYLACNLKIRRSDASCIGFKIDEMYILTLRDLLDEIGLSYETNGYNNIMSLKINNLNVILFDAPIKL